MILFSVVTAALVFVALVFLLPPLLGKARNRSLEQKAREAREALKAATDKDRKKIAEELLATIENEQEQPAATSRAGALVVALLVPLLALGMYAWLGSPELVDGGAARTAAAPASHGAGGMTMAQAISKLEERLREDPDNAEGWYMLARSYVAEKQYGNAARAMERVVALEGEKDPNLLLQYADALAMAYDGRVAGKPAKFVHKALKLKPDYPEALWLAGIAASQSDNLADAIVYWRKAVALLDDQPESQAELKKQIEIAEEKLTSLGGAVPPEEPAVAASPSQQKPVKAATNGASISVTVALSPTLADKVSPDDAVFIYARAASGPPMPLAATRTTVARLPVTVTLDDSQAMMPQMKLSSFSQVVVGARVSKSGQAIPQPGDLEGVADPVAPTSTPEVKVVIDSVR